MIPIGFAISDLLQNRAQAGKTGRFALSLQEEKADIYLQDGHVVHASIKHYQGEAAAYIILKWGNCIARWVEGETSSTVTLFKTVDDLLLAFAFLANIPDEELAAQFAEAKPIEQAGRSPLSLLLSGGSFETFRVDLTISCIILGRSQHLCHVVIPDFSVSAQHGMLMVNGRTVHYCDLGSTNGTWHGENMVTETEIEIGQSLKLGGVTLQLCDFYASEAISGATLENYLSSQEKDIDQLVVPIEAKPNSGQTVKIHGSVEKKKDAQELRE